MLTFIFKFGLMEGQCQVKLGDFVKFKVFSQKHAYFVSFCFRIPKMTFILMYKSQKCQQLRFIKAMPSPLPIYFLPLHAQNKDIALKFCTHVVCM